MQTRSSDENSVHPSVCQTYGLWQNGRKNQSSPFILKIVTPGAYFFTFFTFWRACSPAQIASFVVETLLMAHKTCFHEF